MVALAPKDAVGGALQNLMGAGKRRHFDFLVAETAADDLYCSIAFKYERPWLLKKGVSLQDQQPDDTVSFQTGGAAIY